MFIVRIGGIKMRSIMFILSLIILSFGLIACEFRLEDKSIEDSFVDFQENPELSDAEKQDHHDDHYHHHDHHHHDDHEHEHSVEIEGRQMRMLTVHEIADLWEIDSQDLLLAIISEFNLEGEYNVSTPLDIIRLEYKFSPGLVKDLAEDLKAQKTI